MLNKISFKHISVLSKETIFWLKPKKDGIFIDATLGGGGHAEALLRQCQSSKFKCQMIGVDLDKEAIEAAKKNLRKFREQIIYVNDNFANIKNILKNLQIKKISGILLDLGVSTYQLENPKRGFSFNLPAELDMRFDQSQKLTAREIVNNWSEKDLREIFYRLGESPFAGRIARQIIQSRRNQPIETTNQLVEIIKKATPPKWRYSRQKHFATNIFRALRMATNSELENLEKAIPDLVDVLEPGGRLIIISFHSLEDRIVKKTFRQLENPCTCPPKIPKCICGKKPQIKILTKKPVLPAEEEIAQNPKARSAKMRVVEKLPG